MSLQLGARSNPSKITMAEPWVTLFRLKGLLDQGGGPDGPGKHLTNEVSLWCCDRQSFLMEMTTN